MTESKQATNASLPYSKTNDKQQDEVRSGLSNVVC